MNVTTANFYQSQTRNWVPLKIRQVQAIVVHHIAAKNASVYDINMWHLGNGWDGGFGYNEYILKSGDVIIGRGDHIGAHCHGHNSTTYGIALEGDYDTENVIPKVQFDSLIERIRYNAKRFPNYKNVFPHSYYGKTNCPGKYFPMATVLAELTKTKSEDNPFEKDLNILASVGIINTPSYWLSNTEYNTDYVRKLVSNTANYIRERGPKNE